jgi:pimeloyl-ACP methyl ester carboxylesterase
VNHRLLDVRGLKLHCLERGEGELSVLLHGWLDHAGSFDRLAPLLPGQTVAIDFRGHGDSQWAGAGGFYHFVEYIADLDGALEVLSPQEPVRIVGHSMGAAVLWAYIDLFGTTGLRKLVFVDEPISIYSHSDWSEQERTADIVEAVIGIG